MPWCRGRREPGSSRTPAPRKGILPWWRASQEIIAGRKLRQNCRMIGVSGPSVNMMRHAGSGDGVVRRPSYVRCVPRQGYAALRVAAVASPPPIPLTSPVDLVAARPRGTDRHPSCTSSSSTHTTAVVWRSVAPCAGRIVNKSPVNDGKSRSRSTAPPRAAQRAPSRSSCGWWAVGFILVRMSPVGREIISLTRGNRNLPGEQRRMVRACCEVSTPRSPPAEPLVGLRLQARRGPLNSKQIPERGMRSDRVPAVGFDVKFHRDRQRRAEGSSSDILRGVRCEILHRGADCRTYMINVMSDSTSSL